MRVLITGSGGFVGSHLVERYRSRGHVVIGIDRKQPREWSRGDLGCHKEHYADIVGLLPDVDGFDLCFHMAAESRIQPSFKDPRGYVMDNVMGTANVLEMCRDACAQMIYAGSSTADDDVAKNVYATTKRTGEMLCQAWVRCFGTVVDVARFYNVYGPRQVEDGTYATVIGIWERQLRDGEKLTVTGDGMHRRDFTHVDDIVDGLVAIAQHGHGDASIYGLGTGRNHGILDVARMFVSDDRIEFIPRPPGESEVTLADVDKTADAIGWKASRRLEDYVTHVIKGEECPC